MKPKEERQRYRTMLLSNIDQAERDLKVAIAGVMRARLTCRANWTSSTEEKNAVTELLAKIQLSLDGALLDMNGELISMVDDVNW